MIRKGEFHPQNLIDKYEISFDVSGQSDGRKAIGTGAGIGADSFFFQCFNTGKQIFNASGNSVCSEKTDYSSNTAPNQI